MSDPESTETSGESSTQIIQRFDWTTHESVPAAIVTVVADVTGTSPTDLSPLHETVNTDALDALVSSGPTSVGDGEVAVTFTYGVYDVVVSSAGDGHVAESETEPAA